ncbi:MAG: hypothetical protein ACXWF4_10955 [Candidatus Aminicenantales bacterium]
MKEIVRVWGTFALLGISAGFVAAQTGSDALGKLGIEKVSAGSKFLSSLTSGYIYDPAAFKAFKALPASARAEVVRAGLDWAKTYVASADFKSAYAKLRESKKPAPPEPVPSAEETLAKMKADVQTAIENMRQAQATADAATKKSIEGAIKSMQAQMEELDKNPQMKENFRLGAEMQRTANKNDYEARLKAWNDDLPEDPGMLVAKRIRQFLTTSADVDFSAALAPRGDKMVFVKDEYEKKPAYWKTCFRAGTEATEAARAFAKAWLAELEKR